ncbi:hypothetical protein D3C84_1258950 [compost metagenome]
MLFIWGLLLTREQKNGIHVTPLDLAGLGITAASIVFLVVASWFMIRIFWLEHGDEITSSLAKRFAKLFRER